MVSQGHCKSFDNLLLSFRYEKALQAKEDTDESLKRRPMSAGEPEMPSQVLYSYENSVLKCKMNGTFSTCIKLHKTGCLILLYLLFVHWSQW